MRTKAFLPVLFVTALPLGAAQAQPVGARPVGAAIATQQQIVAAQTAYLLQLYALENGAPATPEVQAELTRRTTDYFTNGAQVTGVPTAGPAAAYFSNGAAVTTIPTSVIPDYTFAPPSISTPTISGAVVDAGTTPQGASPPSPPRLPEAGAATVPEETGPANSPGAVAPPPQAQEEAAAPPAATPAGDNAPSPPSATATAVTPPAATPSTGAASAPPPSPAVHAARPPPTTRMSSVVWAMLGGLGVGAALVLLGVGVGSPRPGGRPRRST